MPLTAQLGTLAATEAQADWAWAEAMRLKATMAIADFIFEECRWTLTSDWTAFQ